MRHALGNQIKKNAYRNYFNTGGDSESWEELVELGLATKQDRGEAIGGIYYYVSEKGIEVLNRLMNC